MCVCAVHVCNDARARQLTIKSAFASQSRGDDAQRRRCNDRYQTAIINRHLQINERIIHSTPETRDAFVLWCRRSSLTHFKALPLSVQKIWNIVTTAFAIYFIGSQCPVGLCFPHLIRAHRVNACVRLPDTNADQRRLIYGPTTTGAPCWTHNK